jgi:DnaJ-class molecular chaperone
MSNPYIQCGRCRGTGKVKGRVTLQNAYGEDEDCPVCGGIGKVHNSRAGF